MHGHHSNEIYIQVEKTYINVLPQIKFKVYLFNVTEISAWCQPYAF